MMFFSTYERRFSDILEYQKRYFEAMNILGAEIFVFHGLRKDVKLPMDFYIERYMGLVNLGKEFGITVAQENVARCESGSLEFLKQLVQETGKDVKFVLDVKQAVRCGYDPLRFVDELGENIAHIHLSDHGVNGDCLLLGEGNFNLNKFIDKLIKKEYNGSIILEFYRGAFNEINELTDNVNVVDDVIKNLCKSTKNSMHKQMFDSNNYFH